VARANRQGRYPKLTDIYSRILRAVLDSEHAPLRFNQLFRKLKPGSLTTFSEAIKKLVADKLLEFDYETKSFRVTERGRSILGGGPVYRLPGQYMAFLVEEELFEVKDEALKSAIEFALGYLNQYVLKGLLTPRSNESEERVRREVLNLFYEDLDQFLHEGVHQLPETHPYWSSLAKMKEGLLRLRAWEFEMLSPFMLMFADDRPLGQTEPEMQTDAKGNVRRRYRSLAEVSIAEVQCYLRKRYPSFKANSLTYDKIRSFVKKRREHG
jgi:hypothetical protein